MMAWKLTMACNGDDDGDNDDGVLMVPMVISHASGGWYINNMLHYAYLYLTSISQNVHKCDCREGLVCKDTYNLKIPIIGITLDIKQCMEPEEQVETKEGEMTDNWEFQTMLHDVSFQQLISNIVALEWSSNYLGRVNKTHREKWNFVVLLSTI
jgi:hypothetical protein